MSSKRITERDFFTCEAVELAEKLIGKIICNRVAGKILRFRIVETEAYGEMIRRVILINIKAEMG